MSDNEKSQHRAKILVCDDDQNVRLLTRQCLEAEGMIVVEAADGLQAVDVFVRERPDLVFLDVEMPGMTGLEVCERIRQLPQGESIPIMIVTGSDDRKSIDAGFKAGARQYKTKPVNWSLLGRDVQIHWPAASPLLLWVLGGQAVLALAEEIYFRGLLLSEIERLAPRLGVRRPIVRRWVALLLTATLFGMEHLMLTPSAADMGRRMFFTVAMGLLFGLLVMVSANLLLAAGIHTWINWLLLGAVPYFTDSAGRSIIPAGLYIGSTLIFAFIAVFILQELRSRHKVSPVRH